MSQIENARKRLLLRANSSSIVEAPEEDSSEFKVYSRNGNASSIPKLKIKIKERSISELENEDNDVEFQHSVKRLYPFVSKTQEKEVFHKSERLEIMSERTQKINVINTDKSRKARRTSQYSQADNPLHNEDMSFTENNRSIYNESPTKSNRMCVHGDKLDLTITKIPPRKAVSPFKPRECESKTLLNEISEVQKKNTLFTDDMFPPRYTIIFNKKYMYLEEGLKLERVSKIYEALQIKLINHCEPTSMVAGKFTSPALYSTLAILSETPTLILNILGNQEYNQKGFYYAHVCKDGVWRYIKVDDHLPVKLMARRSLLFLHSVSKNGITEFWPAILEKVLAKIYGTYQDILLTADRGIREVMRVFTGFPVSQYYINKDFRSYLVIIDSAIKKKQIVVLELIYEDYKETAHLKGLEWDLSYQVIEVSKNYIILRNLQEKELVTKLTFEEAMIFNKLLIFRAENNYSYISKTLRHKKKSYSIVRVKVKSSIKGYWDVWENNEVYYKNHIGSNIKYQKSEFVISIKKEEILEENETITDSGKEIEMEAGTYQICVHLCQAKEQDFTLSFYGEESIEIERVKNNGLWNSSCQC